MLLAVVAILRRPARSSVVRSALAAIGAFSMIFLVEASAPDVALTEGLALAPVLFAMKGSTSSPTNAVHASSFNVKTFGFCLAVALLMTLTLYAMVPLPTESQTEFFVNHSYFSAGGRNLVQMIHADFRVLDALLGASFLTSLWIAVR